MFRVAVCDNDKHELEALKRLVIEYLMVHPELDGECRAFSSPLCLRACLDGDEAPFEAYVLDVMMPEIDGIKLGELIQRSHSRVPIIFTTSSKEFALRAFGVRALQYLLKPVGREDLFKALDDAVELVEGRRTRAIQVKTRSGVQAVPVDDILYVANASRSTRYVLKDGSIVDGPTNRGTFESSVGEIAADGAFVHPHKSYFVNMGHIRSLANGTLVLDNGEHVPISRRNAADTKKRYVRYMTRGNEGEV